ncbi:MFS transporter, metabolite:H+ symporter (MHS) family protein [compost metagenome]
MWSFIESGDVTQFAFALAVLSVPLGLTYGPQAALYAEMFPADVRYSGVSAGYALGSILGGAFAAMIAQSIITATGQSWHVGVYVIVMAVVSLVAVSLVKDRPGVTLHAD